MALQLEITTPQGFASPTAYAKIVNGYFTKNSIQINVEIFKDKEARDSGLQPIRNINISFPLANGATFEVLYAALKTDSNFANAIDC